MRILQVLPSLQLQRRTLRGFPSSESMESSSPPVLFAHLAMSRSLFSTAFCTCNPNAGASETFVVFHSIGQKN